MPKFENIYDTMSGLLLESYAVPEIENLFLEGGYCDREYDRMRSAYERLCRRLGEQDEDEGLNIMVDALENIQKVMCKAMYELGQEKKWEIEPCKMGG